MLDKSDAVSVSSKGDAWIDCPSLDKVQRPCGFIIKAKDIEAFRASLQAIRGKYTEWKIVAAGQEVKDLFKEMPVGTPRASCYFTYGDLFFTLDRKPKVYFSVGDGKMQALIIIGDLVASTNQFIKSEGVLLAFSNELEIDELHALLDPVRMKRALHEKQQKEDLFK